MNAKAPLIDIGISAAEREKIAHGLSALLADSYTLYLMTHNFHWNVTGPQFNSLHLMFMGQYTEQWTALDIIAERIRALGYPAPGTYKEFVALASVKEVEGVPKATDMIRHLVAAQEATARTARIIPGRRRRERPADGRSADPASGSARENRLDAAQPAGRLASNSLAGYAGPANPPKGVAREIGPTHLKCLHPNLEITATEITKEHSGNVSIPVVRYLVEDNGLCDRSVGRRLSYRFTKAGP
jgi:starvation-inducible DNA-binding protein